MYRQVLALLRLQSEETAQPVVNAKRTYRVMRTQAAAGANTCSRQNKRPHKGHVPVAENNRRWCSDGFEFRCDNSEKLRVTLAQDCRDRKIIDSAAETGGYDTETVHDVMLRAVKRRFGQELPLTALEWLTDNRSAYRAQETRAFVRMLGLNPRTMAARSPEINEMAKSVVRTINVITPASCLNRRVDSASTVVNLSIVCRHLNGHHPYSALGYRPPGHACAGKYHNRKNKMRLVRVKSI